MRCLSPAGSCFPARRAGSMIPTMGFQYRRRKSLGHGTHVNLSKSGASLSKKAGRLTLNSRGGGSFRIAPGLSFRFGKRR